MLFCLPAKYNVYLFLCPDQSILNWLLLFALLHLWLLNISCYVPDASDVWRKVEEASEKLRDVHVADGRKKQHFILLMGSENKFISGSMSSCWPDSMDISSRTPQILHTQNCCLVQKKLISWIWLFSSNNRLWIPFSLGQSVGRV